MSQTSETLFTCHLSNLIIYIVYDIDVVSEKLIFLSTHMDPSDY